MPEAIGGITGGGSPNTNPSVRGLGKGGLPMKKRLFPKSAPKRLKENVGWKKSFSVYQGTHSRKKTIMGA